MIGSARMTDRLYYFEEFSLNNKKGQGFRSVSSILVCNKIMLWHLRLGHPSFSYLKNLLQMSALLTFSK